MKNFHIYIYKYYIKQICLIKLYFVLKKFLNTNVEFYWIKTHGNIDEYDEARSLITSDEYKKQPYIIRRLYDILRHPIIFYII